MGLPDSAALIRSGGSASLAGAVALLQILPGVDGNAVEHDRIVKVGARASPGIPDVSDPIALFHRGTGPNDRF